MILGTVLLALVCGCQGAGGPTSKALSAKQGVTRADVSKALTDAQKFAKEGQYEKALERHVWYHENALKYDQAQYGVRLSFALAYWAELGKKYPKALDVLRKTRDKALETYRKDPADKLQFAEVMAIDLQLDDLASAKELFYEGRKNGVDDPFLMLALDRIRATGDLKWARDVIGDPQEALEDVKERRRLSLRALRGRPDSQHYIDILDEGLGRELVTLIQAVEAVDGAGPAKSLREDILAAFDSPVIRAALKTR